MISDENGSRAFTLLFMLAFGNNESSKDLPILSEEELTQEKRKELIEGLPYCVMFLYSRFRGFDDVSRPIRKNKIGRNDPCPCGSGKKYKKCCLNKIFT
jgi:preprotein translocase subunit SecA